MEKNISCELVRDLLPNYMEKLTSEETNKIMEEHFSTCPGCSSEREAMMSIMKSDKVPEDKKMLNYLKKTKNMYLLKGIFLSIGMIGIIVSFIVDIAINRSLTWSLIVDVSILYFYVCAMTGLFSKKHKVMKLLAAVSILILPLLFVIENVVNNNFVNQPVYWFRQYALPISLLWIGVIWITVLVRCLMKTNIWNTIGIFLLLSTIASAFTNAIANQVTFIEIYRDGYEFIDTMAYLLCAMVCFIIGYLRKGKGKF